MPAPVIFSLATLPNRRSEVVGHLPLAVARKQPDAGRAAFRAVPGLVCRARTIGAPPGSVWLAVTPVACGRPRHQFAASLRTSELQRYAGSRTSPLGAAGHLGGRPRFVRDEARRDVDCCDACARCARSRRRRGAADLEAPRRDAGRVGEEAPLQRAGRCRASTSEYSESIRSPDPFGCCTTGLRQAGERKVLASRQHRAQRPFATGFRADDLPKPSEPRPWTLPRNPSYRNSVVDRYRLAGAVGRAAARTRRDRWSAGADPASRPYAPPRGRRRPSTAGM